MPTRSFTFRARDTSSGARNSSDPPVYESAYRAMNPHPTRSGADRRVCRRCAAPGWAGTPQRDRALPWSAPSMCSVRSPEADARSADPSSAHQPDAPDTDGLATGWPAAGRWTDAQAHRADGAPLTLRRHDSSPGGSAGGRCSGADQARCSRDLGARSCLVPVSATRSTGGGTPRWSWCRLLLGSARRRCWRQRSRTDRRRRRRHVGGVGVAGCAGRRCGPVLDLRAAGSRRRQPGVRRSRTEPAGRRVMTSSRTSSPRSSTSSASARTT